MELKKLLRMKEKRNKVNESLLRLEGSETAIHQKLKDLGLNGFKEASKEKRRLIVSIDKKREVLKNKEKELEKKYDWDI